MSFVLATANPDKATEIRAILAAHGVLSDGAGLVPRPDDVPDVEETGETLLDNARLKARALADATGMAAIADDTGLEVDALDGAPGVYSARYAGEHATYADNVAKLLAALDGVAEGPERSARFTTVAIALWPDGREVVAVGSVEGTITTTARGSAGFGYDPVFQPEGSSSTFAEMDPEAKHAVSHRGRAFATLAAGLAQEG